jgi:serine/threonine protein kinase
MGVVFGPYRLEELLGRGGMGEVYRALDTRKDRTVALKRLHPSLAVDESFQERFRREAKLTARLASPHVIPIHDYGVIEDWLFIDMRLAQGADLAAVLAREGPLPAARAVEIVAQVADALDAAHQAGLVHRDVKPSNVVVSSHRGRDFVYLVDFGIVRALGSSTHTSLTATGSAIGTLAYMAPELFTDATPPDHRVDVYALGCLLYETLTGRPPFTHEGPALMFDHLHTPPPKPSTARPELPAGLDDVVARAMAKHPQNRYPTPGDLATTATRASVPGPPTKLASSAVLESRKALSGSPAAPGRTGWRIGVSLRRQRLFRWRLPLLVMAAVLLIFLLQIFTVGV